MWWKDGIDCYYCYCYYRFDRFDRIYDVVLGHSTFDTHVRYVQMPPGLVRDCLYSYRDDIVRTTSNTPFVSF